MSEHTETPVSPSTVSRGESGFPLSMPSLEAWVAAAGCEIQFVARPKRRRP